MNAPLEAGAKLFSRQNQCVAIGCGLLGELIYKLFEPFAGCIAQGRCSTEISCVRLDEIRIEAVLADQKGKADRVGEAVDEWT